MAGKKLRVIITGATGMVGEGVLHECLQHPDVEKVLIVNRRPAEITHPKLMEIVHQDFFDLSAIESHLGGYNACFFCLGVSSVGMKQEEYYRFTHTLTLNFAQAVLRQNADMSFVYISGAGTDETESARLAWARVKGKTENDLARLPFAATYAFRPGFIKPTKGLKRANKLYRYLNWMFPIGRKLFPNGFCTLRELGLAMINVGLNGYQQRIVEGRNIIELGRIK